MALQITLRMISGIHIFRVQTGCPEGTPSAQTIGEGLTSYGYTYDNNGNMLSDQLNRTGSIKYDHRNLMTEIRVIKTEANPDPFGTPTIDVLYLTNYRYDEAGNRVRKFRYKYIGSTPDPIFEEGDSQNWTLQSDEYYVRDISGKEIAIYSGSSLTQWNIWGLDNVGKINADTTRNYYLKDHLGSIRVVLNSTNTVVSAQDYDCWGYILENRTYNSSAMKYDFTGKERDDETNYDYFGARYYDSRIGRWGQVEPLLDKYVSWSPYVYTLCNPVIAVDVDGRDGEVTISGTVVRVDVPIYYTTEGKFGLSDHQVSKMEGYVGDANTYWNKAGNTSTEYQGQFFTVEFNFHLVEIGSSQLQRKYSDLSSNPTGENVAFPSVNENYLEEIGVNSFKISVGRLNEGEHAFRGSHEMGHTIGLGHPLDRQNNLSTVMSWSPNRPPPTKQDIQFFLNKLDFNKQKQVVKGDIPPPPAQHGKQRN